MDAEQRGERADQRLEHLSAVLDSAPLGLIEIDRGLIIRRWTGDAPRLLGWTETEALGRRPCELELFDDETRCGLDPVLHQLLTGRMPRAVFTGRTRCKDGTWATCEWHGSAVRDLAGAAGVVLLVLKKSDGEPLTEVDRRTDELLAILGHELRNPLAPILSGVEILARSEASPALAARARRIIEQQVRKMSRLIDDLLDVARITSDKIELRRERLDLGQAVRAAVDVARPLVEAARLDLTLTLPERPLLAEADPGRIGQVLANLLGNAVKFTPAGGSIEVALTSESGAAVLRVADSGVGIAAEDLPHIFDLFAQADRRRSAGGLGIGLAVARRLVELHGGRIEARSDGAGRGAELLVRLPTVAERRRAPRPVAPAPPIPPGGGRRILIVDDDGDAAEALGALLRLAANHVRIVHDGQAALEMLESFPAEVVLLDLAMPGLDGCEVARRIRSDPARAGTRLVALTGLGQERYRRQAIAAGFDHHLTKPVGATELQELLARALPR